MRRREVRIAGRRMSIGHRGIDRMLTVGGSDVGRRAVRDGRHGIATGAVGMSGGFGGIDGGVQNREQRSRALTRLSDSLSNDLVNGQKWRRAANGHNNVNRIGLKLGGRRSKLASRRLEPRS